MMQKTWKLLLAGVMIAGLSGCRSTSDEPADNASASKPAETAVTEQETAAPAAAYEPVTELFEDGEQTLINAYASVMDETFGAEIDFSAPYSSDDIAQYYEVKNFSSIDEIRAYITTYVDDALIDQTSFADDFKEVDGKLCAVRGGRGYGYYGIDTAAWSMDTDTVANVQFTLMGEAQKDSVVTLTFGKTGDVWKVVEAVLPEGF
jgi:hypothetical protein